MPERPSVRGIARQAEVGARDAVGRIRTRQRPVLPPPDVGLLPRLRDRIEQGEFLRLRGRFRGRRGLVANIANTVAEFAGASAALEIFGVPRWIVVPVVAAGIWALVLFASYRTVERVFLSISLVFVTYIASAVLADPDWGRVGDALITPTLNLQPSILLLVVAVVGTTITPYMQFYLQSAVAEKAIDEDELRLEQADALGGAIWTNVIAIFIVVATATTVFAMGGNINSAVDAARALEPVAGQFAEILFAIGLFGASVLAATIMPISTAD